MSLLSAPACSLTETCRRNTRKTTVEPEDTHCLWPHVSPDNSERSFRHSPKRPAKHPSRLSDPPVALRYSIPRSTCRPKTYRFLHCCRHFVPRHIHSTMATMVKTDTALGQLQKVGVLTQFGLLIQHCCVRNSSLPMDCADCAEMTTL